MTAQTGPLRLASLAILLWAAVVTADDFKPTGVRIPQGYDTCYQKLNRPICPTDLFAALQRLDVARMRRHAWNVFAGMTHTDIASKLPIFRTWYRKCDFNFKETRDCGYDEVPAQLDEVKMQVDAVTAHTKVEAAARKRLPDRFVAMNFYNYELVKFIFDQKLCDTKGLLGAQSDAIGKQMEDSHIAAFPTGAIAVKTGWMKIDPKKPTLVPVWDPEANSLTEKNGNLPIDPSVNLNEPAARWSRYVAIDPTLPAGSPGSYKEVATGEGIPQRVHVLPLSSFYSIPLKRTDLARLPAKFALMVDSDEDQIGYLVLVALHFTTKEIPNWVWATFWWHDQPDAGPYGSDRPGLVVSPWNNYLMTVSYSMNEPREFDGGPHIAFNPWLEGPLAGGVQSNCMSCHRRAAWPAAPQATRDTSRGEVSLEDTSAFPKVGELPRVKTDFIWTVARFENQSQCGDPPNEPPGLLDISLPGAAVPMGKKP